MEEGFCTHFLRASEVSKEFRRFQLSRGRGPDDLKEDVKPRPAVVQHMLCVLGQGLLRGQEGKVSSQWWGGGV